VVGILDAAGGLSGRGSRATKFTDGRSLPGGPRAPAAQSRQAMIARERNATPMQPDDASREVERLLAPDARARLPLWRQLVLYLNPFALFKDAARGPAGMRERALAYNRAMRWMLLPYARRWSLIGAASFAGVLPAEALAAESSLFVIPAAASALSACVALTVVVCTVTAYLLLGSPGGRR